MRCKILNNKETENKLIILYLLDKMDLPLSRSQITDYIRQSEFMDYYTLQQTMAEMVDGGYLDAATDNNTTRYTVTEEGLQILEYFEKHISPSIRARITQYITENHKEIKRSFENTATFFPNADNDEFTVKCGVYEEGRMLMEIAISVDTREQARIIQNNWKANAKSLYGDIIRTLASGK